MRSKLATYRQERDWPDGTLPAVAVRDDPDQERPAGVVEAAHGRGDVESDG